MAASPFNYPRECQKSPSSLGFSDQGLRLVMTRACKLAGIRAYSPRDLRHRYIALLVMAGVPLPVVQRSRRTFVRVGDP